MRSGTYNILTTIALLVLINSSSCFAKEKNIVIIYPNTKEPLNRIYTNIIKGITYILPQSKALAIDNNNPSTHLELETSLLKNNPDKIIALGRITAEKVSQTKYRDKIIVGAAFFNPDEYAGVSLVIDGQTLLEKIKSSLPFIKNVFVIDTPDNPSIKIYPELETLENQLSFTLLYNKNPLINIKTLWTLLNEGISTTDAIMLPSNLDKDILYELSQLAWEKNIILLSTNLSHLKEGVLMVFYPNNIEMGKQIGYFAATKFHGPIKKKRYQDLTHIRSMSNPTISKHLGLDIEPNK